MLTGSSFWMVPVQQSSFTCWASFRFSMAFWASAGRAFLIQSLTRIFRVLPSAAVMTYTVSSLTASVSEAEAAVATADGAPVSLASLPTA